MPSYDSERERQRLAELYSSMNDGELEELAAEAAELSDEAKAALESEVARRGLAITLAEPDSGTIDYQPLVTIRQFRDLPAALLAKGALDAAGIECHLADDNMVRTDWFISNLLGGVKLNVLPKDVDEANQVLETPVPDGLTVEGVGEFRVPTCPTCGSDEVAFEGMNKKVFLASAVLSPVAIPVPRNSWKCYDCGTTWQDQDDEDTLNPASPEGE